MSEKLLKILSNYLISIGKLPKDFVIEYVVDEKYGDYLRIERVTKFYI